MQEHLQLKCEDSELMLHFPAVTNIPDSFLISFNTWSVPLKRSESWWCSAMVKRDGAQVCGSEVSHPWLTGLNLPCDTHDSVAMVLNRFPQWLCVVTSGLHTDVSSQSCLLTLTLFLSPLSRHWRRVVTVLCNKLCLLGTDQNWWGQMVIVRHKDYYDDYSWGDNQ